MLCYSVVVEKIQELLPLSHVYVVTTVLHKHLFVVMVLCVGLNCEIFFLHISCICFILCYKKSTLR